MSHDVISICPVCSSDLTVSRLHCGSCGTTLEGEFSVGRFSRLGRDQMALLESFLRSRGNLREMERELGLSYPTVRARVDALVRALGLADDAPDGATGEPTDQTVTSSTGSAARQAILERLARREISADDAATEIRALRRTDR